MTEFCTAACTSFRLVDGMLIASIWLGMALGCVMYMRLERLLLTNE